MTHSTVRLWDHDFRFIATEDIPETEVLDIGSHIRIKHREHQPGPLTAAITDLLQHRLRNLHVTIDKPVPDMNSRRGGIVSHLNITEESCACGHCHDKITTLTIELVANPNSQKPEAETIYPPRGYGIGLLAGGNGRDTIIGNWATEAEARQALADLRIVALGGARPSWDTGR